MGPKYEHFKFAIGAFVQPKILAETQNINRKMQIVERLYQECPGGVQLHYTCRCAGLIGSGVRFLEIEIEEYTEAAAWDSAELRESRKVIKEALGRAKSLVEETTEPPTPEQP